MRQRGRASARRGSCISRTTWRSYAPIRESGDLSETYLFAREHPGVLSIAGIVLVSAGIISLALQRGKVSGKGAFAAFVTGATIAVYTVIDGIGVRESGDALAYTAWMFVFYLLMPPLFIAMARHACTARAVAGHGAERVGRIGVDRPPHTASSPRLCNTARWAQFPTCARQAWCSLH